MLTSKSVNLKIIQKRKSKSSVALLTGATYKLQSQPQWQSSAKHWSAKMEECKPSEISSSKMFDGYNKRYKHFSPTLGCSMTFHIYFPPSPSPSHKFPVSLLHPLLFLHFQILKFHTQIKWVFHPILTA